MARRNITVFNAWQSDRPTKINRDFIRGALDEAAKRITSDAEPGVVMIDADRGPRRNAAGRRSTLLLSSTRRRCRRSPGIKWCVHEGGLDWLPGPDEAPAAGRFDSLP